MKMNEIPGRRVNGSPDEDDGIKARIGRPPKDAATKAMRIVGGFKIESDIPLPEYRGAYSLIYDALAVLEPGESILCKGKKVASVPSKAKLKWPTRFFIARVVPEGVRIWRKN